MSKQKNQETMQKTFEQQQRVALGLIANLKGLIEAHGKGKEIHFGHVGDLANVINDLRYIQAFLTGYENDE